MGLTLRHYSKYYNQPPLSTLLKSFLAGKIQMVQKYVNDKN